MILVAFRSLRHRNVMPLFQSAKFLTRIQGISISHIGNDSFIFNLEWKDFVLGVHQPCDITSPTQFAGLKKNQIFLTGWSLKSFSALIFFYSVIHYIILWISIQVVYFFFFFCFSLNSLLKNEKACGSTFANSHVLSLIEKWSKLRNVYVVFLTTVSKTCEITVWHRSFPHFKLSYW